MATMTLLPNSSPGVGAGSGWSWSGGTSFHDVLDSNDGDTSYAASDGTNDGVFDITGFRDPTVAAADIASITSVQYTTRGKRAIRSRLTANCDFEYLVPSGFLETMNYATVYSTEDGTARTTKPDGSVWTYSDLEGLQMRMTKNGIITLRLTYLAIIVTYISSNTVFFGTNF